MLKLISGLEFHIDICDFQLISNWRCKFRIFLILEDGSTQNLLECVPISLKPHCECLPAPLPCTAGSSIMTATMFEFLKDTKITHIITYVLVVASVDDGTHTLQSDIINNNGIAWHYTSKFLLLLLMPTKNTAIAGKIIETLQSKL